MNDLAPTPNALPAMTTDQLKSRLTELLSVTAETLLELAAIVKELEWRGEDLENLKLSMIHWLRLIANGQLLPEVVVKFQATPMVMRKIARLPIPDQRRLANGGSVDLLANEKGETRSVPPDAMSRDEIEQAFATDHIRSLSEQRGVLDSRSTRRRTPTRDTNGIIVDRRRNVLKLPDGTTITRAELLDYLRRLED